MYKQPKMHDWWKVQLLRKLFGRLPGLLGKGPGKDMVECTSRKGRPQSCEIPADRIANLVDVLGGSFCEEGHTLFYDTSTIKVTSGCSGIFKLSANFSDCEDLGITDSGVYRIKPDGASKPVNVYCDMVTDRGHWTVLQRRMNGNLLFMRGWEDYKSGFGSASEEYWIGNENIHLITNQGEYELRIDLADFDGNQTYVTYNTFSVDSESTYYQLTIGGFWGPEAGDSMEDNHFFYFGTLEVDHDEYDGNCALLMTGAWLYADCGKSNLNGQYLAGPTHASSVGVVWETWRGASYSLRYADMKVRKIISPVI
ncbi:hypothetical protein ScPMuIL_003829 [Solemya velum]